MQFLFLIKLRDWDIKYSWFKAFSFKQPIELNSMHEHKDIATNISLIVFF